MRHYTLLAVLSFCAAIPIVSGAKASHLDFVSNGHQWPEQVRYKADLPGGAVFLTNTGFTYNYYSLKDANRIHDLRHEQNLSATSTANEIVHGHAYSVTLDGANTAAAISEQRKTPNYYNYFLGNDPSQWSGGMAAYEEIDYSGIYNGIDLKVYSKGTSLKYDFVVSPGADVTAIKLAFEGVVPMLTPEGDLLIKTSVNELREKAPYAYQIIDGKARKVPCRFTLEGTSVGFTFPKGYDRNRVLIIDPVLVFATYSGSTSTTYGWSATYDASGNLYAGGENFATGWPVSTGAYQTTFGGVIDDGINKYSGNGTSLIYSTYYGGSSSDFPNTMVVNNAGELIVAGGTMSTNLPVSSGCIDATHNGLTDIYVVHFNANGTGIVGATYLGGSNDEGNVSTATGHLANAGEVLSDASGNIYVAFTTKSSNFPTTSGAFQTALSGTMDGFVTKMNGSCSNLIFSTFIGGTGIDAAIAIQLTGSGKIVVGGGTTSTNFPGVTGGWQSSLVGSTDGFIAILNNSGSAILNATYVGTAGLDNVAKLQIDGAGNVYAMGTNSTGAFPVSSGVYSMPNGKIFMAKLDATLSNRLLSTTISGSSVALEPSAFLLDVCGHLYFVGYGANAGLPTTSNAYRTTAGGFWMCVLDPNMAALAYASYFGEPGDHIDGGSSRMDPAGIVYHSICTPSALLPTSSGVWSSKKKTSGYDIASWKFDFQQVGMAAGFNIGIKDTFCAPATVTINNTSYGALSYLWDFGDGSATSALAAPPPHLYPNAGTYRIKLYTYNATSCVTIDSAFQMVYVFDPEYVDLKPPSPLIICSGDSARMKVKAHWKITVLPNTYTSYNAGDTVISFYPDSTADYQVYATLVTPCNTSTDSIKFTIVRDDKMIGHLESLPDKSLCKGDTAVYELSRKMDRFTITPATYFKVSNDSMSLKVFPPVDTRYQLVSVIANACTSIHDTVIFNVKRSTLKAAFALNPKETDQNQPVLTLTNVSKNATGYNWSLNNNYWNSEKSPSLTTTDTGYYCFMLIANDEFNCKDSASDCAHVIETHIYMPSAFTPNHDGKNDVFRPILHNVDILEFSVFNRYGERIFVTYDNEEGWNGTYHGMRCDLGTYFYSVRYRVLAQERTMTGDITLLR